MVHVDYGTDVQFTVVQVICNGCSKILVFAYFVYLREQLYELKI